MWGIVSPSERPLIFVGRFGELEERNESRKDWGGRENWNQGKKKSYPIVGFKHGVPSIKKIIIIKSDIVLNFRMEIRLRLGSYLFRELQQYVGVTMLEFKWKM